MDIDWEVEIGGDAPVIEAQWPGFIDLRKHPECVDEIFEVTLMAPLRELLLALNSGDSPVWTSKCDVWEPEPNAIACYVDILPREPQRFADWKELEKLCRALVSRIMSEMQDVPPENSHARRALLVADGSAQDTSLNLVIRRALIGENDGFGISAYFAAANPHARSAKLEIGALMGRLSEVVMAMGFPP